MNDESMPGQIVILNGAPRSGKSSIAAAIQGTFEGAWLNLGVDTAMRATPPRYQPGIGLRPGGERPDLEDVIVVLFAALYESIAAHSRFGLNVVAEFGHHDAYSRPRHILNDCARRLTGLPVLFVGIHCPLDVIMERRNAGQEGWKGRYVTGSEGEPVPAPVARWQEAVHAHGLYDMELDTSLLTPGECASRIAERLRDGSTGSAFERLARR